MRINVYSQELTDEVIHVVKQSNTGMVYEAAQLIYTVPNVYIIRLKMMIVVR